VPPTDPLTGPSSTFEHPQVSLQSSHLDMQHPIASLSLPYSKVVIQSRARIFIQRTEGLVDIYEREFKGHPFATSFVNNLVSWLQTVRDMRDQHRTLFEWYDADSSVDFIVGRWRPENAKDIFGDEKQWLEIAKRMARARDELQSAAGDPGSASRQPAGTDPAQFAKPRPIEPLLPNIYRGSNPYSFLSPSNGPGFPSTAPTFGLEAFSDRLASPPHLSAPITSAWPLTTPNASLPSLATVSAGTYAAPPQWPGAKEGDPLDKPLGGSPPQ
jgi:hypothetical protein